MYSLKNISNYCHLVSIVHTMDWYVPVGTDAPTLGTLYVLEFIKK